MGIDHVLAKCTCYLPIIKKYAPSLVGKKNKIDDRTFSKKLLL